jgi:DNA-binding GntR family transcriptional regulator
VAEALKAEIANGELAVNARLPTEFELCRRFKVSRSTVRQALASLESAGLVKRRQGSGTTVVAREPAVRYSLSISSEAEIMRYASETTFEVLEADLPVNAVDSRRLRLGAPSDWRMWRGLRRGVNGGMPIGVTTVHVPMPYVDSMKALERTSHGAIFDYLVRANGLTLTAIDQEISATIVDEQESALLQTPASVPALSVVRRYVAAQGPFEVAETIYPSDRFIF